MTRRKSPKSKPKRQVRCGMTIEWYDEQLKKQGGGCAICGRRPYYKRLAVDHDHQSGVIRGLLCWVCNRRLLGILEKFKIDPKRLLIYVEEHGSARLNILPRNTNNTQPNVAHTKVTNIGEPTKNE